MAFADSEAPPTVQTGGVGSRSVDCVCSIVATKMQTLADLFLLQSSSADATGSSNIFVPRFKSQESDPHKCRATVVSSGKGLATTIRLITSSLVQKRYSDLCTSLETLADQVVVIIESTALIASTNISDLSEDADYLENFDRCLLIKCELDIASACRQLEFEHGPMSSDRASAISSEISSSVGIIQRGCLEAKTLGNVSDEDKKQIALLGETISAAYVAFANCLKRYMTSANQSADCREKCLIISKPFLAAIAALRKTVVCSAESLQKPSVAVDKALIKQVTGLLGSTMAVVSSCIRFVEGVQFVLEDLSNNSAWNMLVSCSKSVAESARLLTRSLKESTPYSSRRPSQ